MPKLIGHLRKKKDFDSVFKLGKSSYDQLLGIKCMPNNLPDLRIGIVISNKVSKKAVFRNRLRRQLRYIAAKHADDTKFGNDLIILVLPAALGQPFADLERSYLFNSRRIRAKN
ncbi:ribonuclease P protein component [Candidatus Falkowbacteria bacterium]|nr:ribonuclease P protein component [Candidatus Falkowbacteria bacterium]